MWNRTGRNPLKSFNNQHAILIGFANRDHGFFGKDEVHELHLITLRDNEKAILTANNKGPVQLHILMNPSQHEQ